jgi:dihydropteroate synthase
MNPASFPDHWRLRTRTLALPRPGGRRLPLVRGIVNVTPDSFSHGLRLVAAGADILDVGGESTRPYSAPVDAEEEWRRVGDVVRRLAAEGGVPVSIDTSKAAVAERAVAAGAEIINDVTGLEGDADMLRLAVASGAAVCAMHMQGTPATMQVDPRYDDVVADIHAYLRRRRDALVTAGIPLERICLDPGIGFGKTHAHNLTLLARADRFLDLGVPILVGHSRKGFIGKLLEQRLGRPATEADRDAGTTGAACLLASRGVQIVRVHAVGLVRAALELHALAD